ncbi:YceI family protein [Oceanicella actignis]|uniref:Polyisoprenoid-binding protein YceI n=1 Tax=Oceanicella actignis TaxID=1189325 RepID=A0A1M7SPC8_9RHOB|nr:YceI family protein [Oceanicella actignis]SES65381.1 Polyisoprenoid-binding protein YceI [Oceanicella actignis]SHN60266.1 Polyisoprenoid-binding protein YceI [Oceanicella actignis]
MTALRAAALAALCAVAAAAAPRAGPPSALWRIDPEASSIAFEYVANGRPGVGRLRRFEGSGVFDPARPQDTTLRMSFDMRSLDLGDPLRTMFAAGPDWFDVRAHPRATFELDRLDPIDPAAQGPIAPGMSRDYMARGRLTVKGRTRALAAPATLELDSRGARARGRATFDPRIFGVGEGPSAAFVSIGPEVAVIYDVRAAPAPTQEQPQ